MKIVCEQKELFKGLNTVSKAVPARTPMSILECILIDASNDRIILSANDTEMGIETKIKGSIVEKGILALNARKLLEMIKNMPENEITIESDSNYNCTISCENTDYSISGKSGEDFISIPPFKKDNPIEISQYTLKEMIQQTIFSISDNDNQKILKGELFDINEDRLRIVSMDGHRISIRCTRLNRAYGVKKIVIPGKTLSEISKIVNGSIEDVVKIYYTENNAIFEFDNTIVNTRLIEGEFFNVDKMLSKDYSTSVKVNKKELLDNFNRASVVIRETDKKPIIMNINDNKMNLSIQSTESFKASDIEIEKEGLDIKIGFNPKFFIDALKVIDDEQVKLYMDGSITPCFIKNDEEDYIYLILPVKI